MSDIVIKSLNQNEKDILRAALQCLKRTTTTSEFHHWGANVMLETTNSEFDFIDKLLWCENGGILR